MECYSMMRAMMPYYNAVTTRMVQKYGITYESHTSDISTSPEGALLGRSEYVLWDVQLVGLSWVVAVADSASLVQTCTNRSLILSRYAGRFALNMEYIASTDTSISLAASVTTSEMREDTRRCGASLCRTRPISMDAHRR
jgi:hypothetical protein